MVSVCFVSIGGKNRKLSSDEQKVIGSFFNKYWQMY